MADLSSVLHLREGEQHVIAATQHLVKALRASKILDDDDVSKILSQLDSRMSALTVITTESRGPGFGEIDEQFRRSEEKIMVWESNQSSIWDSGSLESQYLKAVRHIQTFVEGLRSPPVNVGGEQRELLNRAERILQIAMTRLEEEVIHILVKHKQYYEPEYLSFRSCRRDIIYNESFVSIEDIQFEEASQRNSGRKESEEYILDLVHPDVIPPLKSIANIMFASNYHQEFFQAFISARNGALEEYLSILKVENFCIEDVLKMEWDSLSSQMKKWVRALKIIIRYLASERRLCDQILGDFEIASPLCFVEISRASLFALLNFGQGIAMGRRGPESLFCLLDMYEVVADNLLRIDTIFSEEAGAYVRLEFHDLLKRLAVAARARFIDFGNAIAANASREPFPKGAIHPLTKYVMNYVRTLTIYSNTLNVLFRNQDAGDSTAVADPENRLGVPSVTYCHLARHLRSIATTLELNLESKSKLYKDAALQHIFLMNNFHYMVEKVKSSELRLFFGDEWIRKHIVKFQQHAKGYERATWSSVLSLLRDDCCPGSSSGSRASPREKCRGFSIAFEEVYKSQTGWRIPDSELREDLQISTSQKVVHAYRIFTGRNFNSIGEKYIKYSPDDVQNYILDLFDGSPRSLQNSRWK